MPDSLFEKEIPRRDMLKTAGITLGGIAAAGLLGACGSSAGNSQPRTSASGQSSGGPFGGVDVSPASSIPSSTVSFGIEPYGDHATFVAGIREGFFRDVGINITPPPLGESVQYAQVVARLTQNPLDIVTWYGPGAASSLAHTSNLTMLGFVDVYIGTYLLASPSSGAKSVGYFLSKGANFAEAMNKTMSQIPGKPAGVNAEAHADFFATLFKLGNVNEQSANLKSMPDDTQVSLAKSGKLDFAGPSGAPQTAELLALGWYPIVSVDDLLKNLPKGDPRAAATIGNVGPATSLDWYNKNKETALRFMSVQFRVIDFFKSNQTKAFADELPYLNGAAGTQLSASDLAVVFNRIDPLIPFEQQSDFWKPGGKYYYKDIYGALIKNYQSGGLLPAGQQFTPDQVTNGAEVWGLLVELKQAYESLLPKAKNLTGAGASLAQKAGEQYQNRNYLDALKMLKQATAG